jgi:hypothetical protein
MTHFNTELILRKMSVFRDVVQCSLVDIALITAAELPLTTLHGAASNKTTIFILSALRT